MIVRPLSGMEELREAVAFQERIWGRGFSERVPVSLLKVTTRLGGVAAGAFDHAGVMQGFVFGMTGLERGRVVHWSDMLAVSPECRDSGVGRRLKWFQRDAVVAQGVDLMYWTCDPLEARNAFVNMERLGAEAGEYVRDMYGESDSPLHRGLGTDRFVMRWDLDAPRVAALAGGSPPEPLQSTRSLPVSPSPEPDPAEVSAATGPPEVVLREGIQAGGLRVPIPADIQAVRDRDSGLATAWRQSTRRILQPALEAGWRAARLLRGESVSYYVLRPPSIP